MLTILFPGRHHLLTKFQFNYLKELVDKGFNGKKIDRIVFAVTSSDHSNTRRNPIPLYLRVLAIEKFSRNIGCEIKIYPIPDVRQTDKFAKYILHQLEFQGGEKLNSSNTFVACSTPEISILFSKLKFTILPLELIDGKKEKYSTLRPYKVIELLSESGRNWKEESSWKQYSSQATQDVFNEYNLGDLIIELFKDSLLNDDADITETRDYNVYSKAMDKNIEFKFNDIQPFVIEGKIVDAGCGAGTLAWHLSKHFKESDIIGIEATRKLYELCKLQEYPNPFVFFYRKNILDQTFKNNTINTFIYSSILHEIYSYINRKALVNLLDNTFNQLVPGGRIVIRDVVGPENGNSQVFMELNKTNGKSKGKFNGKAKPLLKNLSTHAKFFLFAKDFLPRKIKFKEVDIDEKTLIQLSLRDAYEFMSKMHYIENWKSEMHEEFGFWSFDDWKKHLVKAGFKIVHGSKPFRSNYIIEKMYKGHAKLYVMEGKNLTSFDYPDTNMILAGEKPKIV
ncbi:MAG TPA: methyltransferase domain-containing protein [Candidatus Nanoarchaeia archaeon]|nr:methyltransferase domain-containing protein [Candidatus Nanoarchaeia archaeon]